MLPEMFSMLEAKAQTERLQKAILASTVRAQAHASRLTVLDSRVSFARLAGVVAFLATLAALFPRWDAAEKFLGVLAFVALFFVGSFFHKKLQRRLRFWQGLVTSFTLSHERMERNLSVVAQSRAPWHAKISAQLPPGHLYATDLDVHSSLFELLDTCSTADGAQYLFDVLLSEGTTPCSSAERARRQARLMVLATQTRLLRELEVLRFQEDYLQSYLHYEEQKNHDDIAHKDTPSVPSKALTVFRYVFAGVSVAAWAYFLIPAFARFFETANLEALLSALMVYALFPFVGLAVFHALVESGNDVRRRANVLAQVLPRLQGLTQNSNFQEFSCTRENAQGHIRRLSLALDLVSLRGNPVLWFFLHLLLPYDALCCAFLTFEMQKTAHRVEAWWKDVVEFDFLCALGRFAAENPTCRFLSETQSAEHNPASVFVGEDVGHPLLPARARITNTFRFEKNAPLVLLTGSNMAGKSTFLRTLGINTLLANMGAPVCAKRYSEVGHRILCAIRVDDSLSEGTSYFYAEVKRLRAILEELSEKFETTEKSPTSLRVADSAHNSNRGVASVPALFLVDEIFRGTNNRERFLGSWHILRALLSTGSFGVVSTHDLALTQLADHDNRLRNMHFREQVAAEKLVFDYLLREGPCPTTNALHIMRAEGLPIPLNPEVLGVSHDAGV